MNQRENDNYNIVGEVADNSAGKREGERSVSEYSSEVLESRLEMLSLDRISGRLKVILSLFSCFYCTYIFFKNGY